MYGQGSSEHDAVVRRKMGFIVFIVLMLIGLLVGVFWFTGREETVTGKAGELYTGQIECNGGNIGYVISQDSGFQIMCTTPFGNSFKWAMCDAPTSENYAGLKFVSDMLVENKHYLCSKKNWYVCEDSTPNGDVYFEPEDHVSDGTQKYICKGGQWLNYPCVSGDIDGNFFCKDKKWIDTGCSDSITLQNDGAILCGNSKVKSRGCFSYSEGFLDKGNDGKVYQCNKYGSSYKWDTVCKTASSVFASDGKVLCNVQSGLGGSALCEGKEMGSIAIVNGGKAYVCDGSVWSPICKNTDRGRLNDHENLLCNLGSVGSQEDQLCEEKNGGKSTYAVINSEEILYKCVNAKWVNLKYDCEGYCGVGCAFKSCGKGKYCSTDNKCTDANVVTIQPQSFELKNMGDVTIFQLETGETYQMAYFNILLFNTISIGKLGLDSVENWVVDGDGSVSHTYALSKWYLKVIVKDISLEKVSGTFQLVDTGSDECSSSWYDFSKFSDGSKIGCLGDETWCAIENKKNVKNVYKEGMGKYLYCDSSTLAKGCEDGEWYYSKTESTTDTNGKEVKKESISGPFTGCANPDKSEKKWCPVQTVEKHIYVTDKGVKKSCTSGEMGFGVKEKSVTGQSGAGEKVMKGDVNCDGSVDNDDITILFKYYAFDNKFPESCLSAMVAAHLDCDTDIDNDDITLLFNFYAFDKGFPSC